MKIRAICIAVVLAIACVLLGGCAQGPSERTLLIYLCGSNLETKQGLAGKNIDELLDADIPTGTRVVIQTGGAQTWRSHNISSSKLQRYEVRDKQLRLLEEHDNASMGSTNTLKDFLVWGTKNYGSKENMLVVWDHGGKSGNKICFDENFDYDALERTELSSALKGANLPFKFDLVVFDACFMATLENAAVMSDHARYLVASQELVPSSGIDYKALVQNMAKLDAKELGKSICNDYLAKSDAKNKGAGAEISLIDLSQTGDMLKNLSDTCSQMVSLLESSDGSFKLASTAKASAIYGAKSPSNLIDLESFLTMAKFINPELDVDKVVDKKNEFVPLAASGDEADTMGISLYFPFEYDRKEMQAYLASCPCEGYAKLLRRTYDNLPAQMVAFTDKGSIADDRDFSIALTPESGRYVASVMYTLSRQDPQNTDNYIIMGTGCEVEYDWSNLRFASNFRGTWPALQGQHLLTSVYLSYPHVTIFSAPILAAEENAELFVVYGFEDNYNEGRYIECCRWGGVGSGGTPSRVFTDLKPGDQVATYAAKGSNRKDLVRQPTLSIQDDVGEDGANLVTDAPLEDGRYRFQFVVTDIAGNRHVSDYGIFDVAGGKARLTEVQPQG